LPLLIWSRRWFWWGLVRTVLLIAVALTCLQIGLPRYGETEEDHWRSMRESRGSEKGR